MILATCISPLILGLASFNVVTGDAINAVKNPEVIPDPGLPTLKELSITSDDLYNIGRPDSSFKMFSSDNSVKTSSIQARFEPRCGPSDSAYNCVAPSGLGIAHFCCAGAAEVSGQSINPNGPSSYCKHVADAVLWSVDHCTRGDQSVAGFQAATGNGNLIVGSTSKRTLGASELMEQRER